MQELQSINHSQLNIGDVVIGEKVFDADFGELTKNGPSLPILIPNPLNHKKEPLFFSPDKDLLKTAAVTMQNNKFNFFVTSGVLGDGDMLPNPNWQIELLKTNKVQAVSMDGAAVAKLAWIFDVPCLVIHSVANVAGAEITEQNTKIAADNAGRFLQQFINRLP